MLAGVGYGCHGQCVTFGDRVLAECERRTRQCVTFGDEGVSLYSYPACVSRHLVAMLAGVGYGCHGQCVTLGDRALAECERRTRQCVIFGDVGHHCIVGMYFNYAL
ncbi:MAG: hypothetical protein E7077_08150 [Bacteroidales bacterium]|jgi:hypothetical protein|nr:hypothetical protein [Bacteroidales bacterium]